MPTSRKFLCAGVLAAAAELLLVPKVILVDFVNQRLWGTLGPADVAAVLLQDVVVSLVGFAGLVRLLRRPTLPRLAAAFACCGVLFGFLLIDCRFRELWLKPIDTAVVKYYLGNAADMASGMEFFFLRDAGFGLTFRRLLFYAALTQVAVWSLVVLVLRWKWQGEADRTPGSRTFWGATATATLLAAAGALAAPHYRYQVEQNPLTGLVMEPLRHAHATSDETQQAAQTFEQKVRPLPEVLAPARQRAIGVAPFRNVVLVLLESWRWKGHELGGEGDGATPTLRRLAREGLFGVCHVSVPHSCKAQFTVMTGRHPFLGLEIREGMRERWPSLFWLLKERLGARTFCFSTQNLAFENLDGILRACGVESRVGPETLVAEGTTPAAAGSSFGVDDSALIEAPVRRIAGSTAPFAALLLTVSSHYPYVFPGKTEQDGNGIESYERSVARTDAVLGQILERFAQRDLMDGTLFVLLGDHGESFGEHGSDVHNNSLYEEEMTVPLVFWSADRRLADPQPFSANQIDVAPTIADLCGASDPGCLVQGVSLLRSSAGGRAAYMSSFFDDLSIARLQGNDKLIYWPGSGQLKRFDLAADPQEKRELPLRDGEQQQLVAPLKAFQAYQTLEYRQ